MFAFTAAAICLLELSAAHYMALSAEVFYMAWQIELVLLVVLGLSSDGGQRDRSALLAFFLWFGFMAATDWALIAPPPLLVQYEAVAFTVLVCWALMRPYFFASTASNGRTVHIAFYKGAHAPILSAISALFGLPFASVSIVAGNTAIRASGRGVMVISDARAMFAGDDYVLVDTGFEPGPDFFAAMADCQGKPTKTLGFLRMRCVANLSPLLKLLGYEPRTIFHKIPSIFYFQCMRLAHGR